MILNRNIRDSSETGSPRLERRLQAEFAKCRTLYQALKEYLPDAEITYAKGINAVGSDLSRMEEALNTAAEADVVLFTIGGKNGWGITSTVVRVLILQTLTCRAARKNLRVPFMRFTKRPLYCTLTDGRFPMHL